LISARHLLQEVPYCALATMPTCLSQAFALLSFEPSPCSAQLEITVRQGFELGAPLLQRQLYQRTVVGLGASDI
jgi:hypothetical protein